MPDCHVKALKILQNAKYIQDDLHLFLLFLSCKIAVPTINAKHIYKADKEILNILNYSETK